ncbi:hypothetical protein [Amycolatopsis sp. YIM 10]|uniref:hypothetical protein n=1 Tax=Amycolatopsis sp. YIM 10 TaxID=2653857 RepID=UPI0012907993|nr:hypothetical protein [Amycolatopsis sp. YIM 10]
MKIVCSLRILCSFTAWTLVSGVLLGFVLAQSVSTLSAPATVPVRAAHVAGPRNATVDLARGEEFLTLDASPVRVVSQPGAVPGRRDV